MNQFDPLAAPVALATPQENVVEPSFETTVALQPAGILNKKTILIAVIAIASIATTSGIFAAISHQQAVAAQEKLQRESRTVVL